MDHTLCANLRKFCPVLSWNHGTTITQIIRLLPPVLRQVPSDQWKDHFSSYIMAIAHVPRILERNPQFVFGKLPCRRSLFLLLKLDYPKSHYFRTTRRNVVYTFVHNCPAVSLQGILTGGLIRPRKMRKTAITFPAWASIVAAAIRDTATMTITASTTPSPARCPPSFSVPFTSHVNLEAAPPPGNASWLENASLAEAPTSL